MKTRPKDFGDLHADPLRELAEWVEAAKVQLGPEMATAMALATASKDGAPAARILLLKDISAGRLVFFTNRDSPKGKQLRENPRAAALFHWPHLGVQIRVEGTVSETPREVSEAYFASRPRGSQLGAWASKQSAAVASREALAAQVEAEALRFEAKTVPLPPFWGGYYLTAERVELWFAAESRLHDRYWFEKRGEAWVVKRLSP
jgi:pyridoxamine 5'-phosphate oxidase